MGHRCCDAAAMFRPDLPGRGWVLDPASPRREASLFNSAGNPRVFRPLFFPPPGFLVSDALPASRADAGGFFGSGGRDQRCCQRIADTAPRPKAQYRSPTSHAMMTACSSKVRGNGHQRCLQRQYRQLYRPLPAGTGRGAGPSVRRSRTGPAAATAGTRRAPAGSQSAACTAGHAAARSAGAVSRLYPGRNGLTGYGAVRRSASACRDYAHQGQADRTGHPHAASHRRCCSHYPPKSAAAPCGGPAPCRTRKRIRTAPHPKAG